MATRLEKVFLFVAFMLTIASSRRISKRSLLFDRGCMLNVDANDAFEKILLAEDIFINIKLEFNYSPDDEMEPLLDNTTDVIDINHWVWIVGRTGELLSTFPFDFEYLSLATLTPGVQSATLSLTDRTNCFLEADDEEKIDIIAATLLKLQSMANLTDDHSICLERQLTRDNFTFAGVYSVPSCYYTILQGSTYFDCWRASHNRDLINLSNIVTDSWLNVVFVLGIIFTFYFYLFILSFFQRKEPNIEMVNNKKRIAYVSINTDLPMGPKYCLFFKGNQYLFVYILRWLFYLCLIIFIQYIPYVIANVSDGVNFERRWDAVFNNQVIKESTFYLWNIYVNVVFFAFGLILMKVWRQHQPWFQKEFIESKMRSHFIFEEFDLPKQLVIPNDRYTGLQSFTFVMKARTKMAMSPLYWKYGLKGFGKFLDLLKEDVKSPLRYILGIILICPFMLVFLLATILNSVPLFYCFLRFFQFLIMDKNVPKLPYLFASIGLVFVEIAFLGKFVSIFAYISGIIGYTFVGMLVNSGTVGPYCTAVIIILGYLITIITEYYNSYCKLLNQVIKIANNLIENKNVELHCPLTPPPSPSSPSPNNNMQLQSIKVLGSGGSSASSTSTGSVSIASATTATSTRTAPASVAIAAGDTTTTGAAKVDSSSATAATFGQSTAISATNVNTSLLSHLPTSHSGISKDKEGLTTIQLELFDKVVLKYRPTSIQIFKSVMQLAIFALVMWVGFSTIILLNDFTRLPDQVKLFGSVIVVGIVPLFNKLMRNETEQQNQDEILEFRIKQDIISYIETNGQFKTMAL